MLKCCQVAKCLSFQIYSSIDSASYWMAPAVWREKEKKLMESQHNNMNSLSIRKLYQKSQ